MKRWFALAVASATLAGCAHTAHPWLSSSLEEGAELSRRQTIPSDQFQEVRVSRLPEAKELLSSVPIVPLRESYEIERFAVPGFRCKDQNRAFLVRALFEHGGTGTYYLYVHSGALWVTHQALGPVAVKHESALVVCLAREPDVVYVEVGGGV